ncbi:MAG TPA: hypothetical protein VEY09_16355 [Pyrinomonadaceae bacterium]|nr:hypothetical protein [Pyrinomonadaceae bacterium]
MCKPCSSINYFQTKPPNARHHPPRRDVISGKLSMEAALFAVGCMPLLGSVIVEQII